MTTREMADTIDKLIETRIDIALGMTYGKRDALLEQVEILKRVIADGFKDHSAAQGVFFGGDSHQHHPNHPIHGQPKDYERLPREGRNKR